MPGVIRELQNPNARSTKRLNTIANLVMFAIAVVAFIFFVFHIDHFTAIRTTSAIVTIGIDLFASLLIVIILFMSLRFQHEQISSANAFELMLLALFIVLYAECGLFFFVGVTTTAARVLTKLCMVMILTCADLLLMFLTRYIFSNTVEKIEENAVRRLYVPYCGCTLSVIVNIISVFVPVFYDFSSDNQLIIKPAFSFLLIFIFYIVGFSLFIVIKHHNILSRREIVTFAFYMLVPTVAFVIQSTFWPIGKISIAFSATSIVMLVLYISVQIEQDFQSAKKQSELKLLAKEAQEDRQRKNEELISMHHLNEELIDTLATVVEYRDMESGEHVKRIKAHTKVLAEKLAVVHPEYKLNEEEIELIVSASAMHDIGKIAIPDNILQKPGKLTDEEFAIMKSHSAKGSEIIEKMSGVQDKEYSATCYEIARYHHERFDGRGYPEGLSGNQIPISAQIVSLADVYDALVNDRVYRKGFPLDVAFNMILDNQCGVFNPDLMECFKLVKPEFEKLASYSKDNIKVKETVDTQK